MSEIRESRTRHIAELTERVDRARQAATGGKPPLQQPEWHRPDWIERIHSAIGSLSAPLRPETTIRQLGDFIQLTEEADTCWRCPATGDQLDGKGNPIGFAGCPLGSHYLRLAEVHESTIRHDSAGNPLAEEECYQVQIASFAKTRCPGPRQRRMLLARRRAQANRLLQGIPADEVDEPSPFDRPVAATPTNQPNGGAAA